MNVQQVIDRALEDPIFASELAAKAGKAARSTPTTHNVGFTTEAWRDLLSDFAESPEELGRLTSATLIDKDGGTTTTGTTATTTATITTITTLACTTTTTTTTTTTFTTTTTDPVVLPEDRS